MALTAITTAARFDYSDDSDCYRKELGVPLMETAAKSKSGSHDKVATEKCELRIVTCQDKQNSAQSSTGEKRLFRESNQRAKNNSSEQDSAPIVL